ncbi:MAG: DUF3179 domain-containing protein [Parcubacteria group bacterium]|nr:DUF3179 domain-containing protein [Parcubacteria group bacterium]
MKKNSTIVLIVFAGIIAVVLWQRFTRDDFNLPRGGEAKTETISIPDGEADGNTSFSTKEIMVTDGVKHSVPLSEIIGGGPPKDGIPSIDNPKFISIAEAEKFLNDSEPGIALDIGGSARFYPFQILVWHEIVNDTIGDQRVLVTYCPLCLSGIVFDPLVRGERVEFGTSGKLWNSNLVMYDRKTESLWPQILGEAVVGEVTGTKLSLLSSDQFLFGDWKKTYLDGEVLSRDTGATRFYGTNPYGSYFKPISFARGLAGDSDTRLPADAFIFGIIVNGKAKAYPTEFLIARGMVEDEFQNITFVLRHEKDLGVVRVLKKKTDGSLERINPFSAFWFSWAATHPETEVYK